MVYQIKNKFKKIILLLTKIAKNILKVIVTSTPVFSRLIYSSARVQIAKERHEEYSRLNDELSKELDIIVKVDKNIKSVCTQLERLSLLLYANKYKGKKCVIIGNGPSVRYTDLDRLKHSGVTTIACNKFYLSYSDHNLRPDFTIACDNQVLEDFGYDIVTKCESNTVIFGVEKDFDSSYSGYFRVERREKFGSDTLFCKTPIFGIPSMGSVVIFSLQLAYFMGFEMVYLYGIDHDFKVVTNNIAEDPWRSAVNEGNHFIKDYRQGRNWAPPKTKLIERGFYLSNKEYEYSDRGLINISRKTKLPYVRKANFDSVFPSC